MEESISSCVGAEALHCDAAAAPSSEESGWTVYFEDLLASEEAARKEAGGVRASAPVVVLSATAKGAEKKKVMKRRRKAGEEDPLEDTAASSPSNVAQVDASSLYGMNEESVDVDGSYMVEVWKNMGCEQRSVHCCENTNGLRRVDRKAANECTELQKRGICLVPFFFAHHHLV